MQIKIRVLYEFDDEFGKTELCSWAVQARSVAAVRRLIQDDLGHALRRSAKQAVKKRLPSGQRFDGTHVTIDLEPVRGVPLEDLFLLLAMEEDRPALMDAFVAPPHDPSGTPSTLRAILAQHGRRRDHTPRDLDRHARCGNQPSGPSGARSGTT